MAVRMNDMVIVLPGITGSVLQKDGRDLWALSWDSAWRMLTSLGSALEDLRLEDPDADDGVRATALFDDVHLIPGLVKVDGYGALMDMLRREFKHIEGTLHSAAPANLLAFPYDWRRDNRRTARELGAFVGERLRIWRDHTRSPDAKAILIGHSMGGLVARYYVEVLGGWRDTRALYTFGTPHRGSPNAVGFVANGFKKLIVDLTEVLRSMPSVYQLLPIYPMVRTGGEVHRVAETSIANVDPERAADALAFHREIEAAVAANRRDADYLTGFATVPFVGTRQRTRQSATIDDGELRLTDDVPEGVDPLLADGDGTVPRLSAIPIELSTELRETYLPERHASLQNHNGVLRDLRERLIQLQVRELAAIRGPEPATDTRSAIDADIDDVYTPSDDMRIEARVVDGPDVRLTGTCTSTTRPGVHVRTALDEHGGVQTFDVSGLEPDTYRVMIGPEKSGPGGPRPVHDVFVIAH